LGAHIFTRGLSVARHERAFAALFRRLWSAALLLGNRPHQRFRQVHLPAADHAFHRGTELSVGGGQGLGHGTRDPHPTWMDLSSEEHIVLSNETCRLGASDLALLVRPPSEERFSPP